MKIELIDREEFNRRTKYWIYHTIYYCPVCSRDTIYRERRHDDKPENWNERNEIIEAWDGCGI